MFFRRSHQNSVGTRLLLVPLQTTRSFPFAGCERSPSSNTVSSDSSRTSSCSLWKVVCFCFFVTSVVCSAGKKPKLEASSTEEPAAGTPSSVKKSPSDSIPGGGEKCIESPDPDRVHGSFKSAEKKTFTVVKKEQPGSEARTVGITEKEVNNKNNMMSFSTSAKRRQLRRFWPPPRTTGRSTIREKVLAKGRNGDVLGANVTDHRAATDDRDSGQLLLLGGSDSESGRSAGECVLKLEPAYLAPAYAGVELDMTGIKDVFGKLRKINKMTGTDDGQDSVDVWAGLHGLVWWSSRCSCAMTPPNHDGFNEPVANALSKCEKAFEGEGGGHCVGAEDGVRQPDCTVAAGGRGGLPGGQVFDVAGNTVEVHVGASDQGRSGSVGAIRREGFKCELKYDGDRALFHLLKDGSVNIYSWN
ncbi:DNA ligase 1 [Culex quinquefasciatus]|uniref:DNA ligase 1 n=1 Tax=Culex quinquefasciatus TaxID=7176 RepID=B0X848_CULQU|nr:DNA ligase 1 [Culex quinquefasciatus]|eukprot:XP_001865820.1 DNA ligase 1 [Culex quinquefasciatus]